MFVVIAGSWTSSANSPLLAQTTVEADPVFVAREAISEKHMAATVNPHATKAALKVLRSGGNAVDAAVAAALTLGVVDGHNSGIGGGCFILIRNPDGRITLIDGREMAPSAASRDMYVVDGELKPQLSRTGPLAVAVPGAVAAYELALRKCGTRTFADLVPTAIELAENGFEIGDDLAEALKGTEKLLTRFDGTRSVFFHADGTVFTAGEVIKQPHLAQTYRMLGKGGAAWFYTKFAKRVAKWMRENGGLLTEEDFARYRAVEREPLITQYRGFQIIGFPPPSSGGIHVAQILGILEEFDLPRMYQQDQGTATHVVAEAMKLAFADRAHWLGDADFVPVPKGLVKKEYLRELAARIDIHQRTPVEGHGLPPAADVDRFSNNRHTTHIAVVDQQGNWVGITATINTAFGSKVIVPGTGVFLNNQMDDFSIQPGVPNAFGLIGAENNCIAPGKRPLSSMSPTLVQKNGEPVLLVGAAGGPKIITSVLLTILRYLDFGQPLGEAVGAPRFHHQWRPDVLVVEQETPQEILESLIDKGHELEKIRRGGVCQAIARTPDGKLIGVSDPRVAGRAGGK